MWVCRLPVHIGPWGSCAFAGDFRKIGASCVGRCRHRPLQTDLGGTYGFAGRFSYSAVRAAGGAEPRPYQLRWRAPEGGWGFPEGTGKPGCA